MFGTRNFFYGMGMMIIPVPAFVSCWNQIYFIPFYYVLRLVFEINNYWKHIRKQQELIFSILHRMMALTSLGRNGHSILCEIKG